MKKMNESSSARIMVKMITNVLRVMVKMVTNIIITMTKVTVK